MVQNTRTSHQILPFLIWVMLDGDRQYETESDTRTCLLVAAYFHKDPSLFLLLLFFFFSFGNLLDSVVCQMIFLSMEFVTYI